MDRALKDEKFASMCNMFHTSMAQAKKQMEQLERFFASRLYPGFVRESEFALSQVRKSHQEAQKKWIQEHQALLQERHRWLQERQSLIHAKAEAEKREGERVQKLKQELELIKLQYGSLLQHKGALADIAHKFAAHKLPETPKGGTGGILNAPHDYFKDYRQPNNLDYDSSAQLDAWEKQHQQQERLGKDMYNFSLLDWHAKNAAALNVPEVGSPSSSTGGGGFWDYRPLPAHLRKAPETHLGGDLLHTGAGTLWNTTSHGGGLDLSPEFPESLQDSISGSSGYKHDESLWWKRSNKVLGGDKLGGLAAESESHDSVDEDCDYKGRVPPARVLHSRIKLAAGGLYGQI